VEASRDLKCKQARRGVVRIYPQMTEISSRSASFRPPLFIH